jgi:chromosome segregation ATPase
VLEDQRVRIASLSANDGHLRDVALEFSPGLNCIIGARGTCKSTIVETLRFLFNSEPDRVTELLDSQRDGQDSPSHQGLIAATLRGGTARMVLQAGSQEPYTEVVVERDTTSESRAYIDGVKAISDRSILGSIELYSQGELQEIATSSAKRLALIDRPHQGDVEASRAETARLARQIAQTGPLIRNLRESIDAAQRRLVEGEPLRARLSEVREKRPKLAPDVAEMRERHQAGERLLARAQQAIDRARAEPPRVGWRRSLLSF